MKYFIITIDTEGDNLWEWNGVDQITTENSCYLERFQKLCEQYNFKPVWLTNYEMMMDSRYVYFITDVVERKVGELGMHLHAWNSPPFYQLAGSNNKKRGKPYLIEYPESVMKQKVEYMTNLIWERTGIRPVSHRAGRWATNQLYFDTLIENGYLVDCSVTPLINWASNMGYTDNSKGSDYRNSNINEHYIEHSEKKSCILEVPVSVRRTHRCFMYNNSSIKSMLLSIYRMVDGKIVLRPNGNNIKQLKWLVDKIKLSNDRYLMFMLHSSELMPGGSPTFKTNSHIEKLYQDLEYLFRYIAQDFRGITLKDYCYIVGNELKTKATWL